MKVKVCGITTYDDAALALDEGVDVLGFNFHPPSPRYLAPEAALEIIRRLPALATAVGLFVNIPDSARVSEMARAAGVQAIQLHGDEAPEYCSRLNPWPVIKAIRVGCPADACAAERYDVRALLFDARDESRFGGTGTAFDWTMLRGVRTSCPVILAGGLHAGNVGSAIRSVRPYAVDVCSGVESAPGRKDRRKMRDFMEEVSNAARL